MARRGSFPVRVRGTSRRQTDWGVGTGGNGVTNVGNTTPQFVGGAIAITGEPLTLIRIRGYFSVSLLLATAASDGFTGAFGIGLASVTAVATGIGSVPTPIAEANGDNWLYWQAFAVKGAQLFAAGAGPGMEQLGTYFFAEIDSKAMRKLDNELSVYAAVEMGAEVGTANTEVHHNSRVLLLDT